MDKMEMMKMLANGYERLAYTNNYILGFEYKGAIYAIECDRMVVSYLTLDKASRGASEDKCVLCPAELLWWGEMIGRI